MTCSICGSPAADDDTFCSQCGTKLASAETKPSETSSLPAKPEPKPRTVIDRLPNAAENVVWPVAIGIAWVATFQIAASIFGGPAGLMLSSLFGLLATPLHLVLWWALWNGLRRIGSPTAKHALVFALIWTMATPVNLLSASCLYTLMGVDSATARGVLNPVSISMGLLGGVSFGSLVWFTVSVGKHHSGKLLRFSKFVWLAVAVSLMAMGVVFFSGMSLAGFLCPPTVAVVVLSFLIADILGALHPEGEKSTGVAKAAIWFAPAFAASLAVCIFAMIKIPADIHEPLNESLSAIRSAATGIPRESKTLSVRPSLQPSGGSPARARKLERLLAFFDNQPDEVLDATIESFELSIQRGRKILDPLARQRAIELVPRILKDAGIDAECRDVKNLQSQGAYSWTATAVVWTEEGGEEEVPVSMEYKKDSDMFYVTILPSEDSASESESEEDDSSETEEEIDDDDWDEEEEDEEETDDDDWDDEEEDEEDEEELDDDEETESATETLNEFFELFESDDPDDYYQLENYILFPTKDDIRKVLGPEEVPEDYDEKTVKQLKVMLRSGIPSLGWKEVHTQAFPASVSLTAIGGRKGQDGVIWVDVTVETEGIIVDDEKRFPLPMRKVRGEWKIDPLPLAKAIKDGTLEIPDWMR